MYNILSFDVSSVSTGWAYLEDSKLKEFGVIKMSDKYSLQEKLYWFSKSIDGLLKICKPDHIVVEETYLKNVKTLKTLMQFIAIVNLRCYEILNKEPVFVSPNTVRSVFCLKTKEDVFNAVKSKYKTKFKSISFDEGNDISDAIMQAMYWLQILKEKDITNE